MSTVWRVENAEGEGPYRTNDRMSKVGSLLDSVYLWNDLNDRPIPQDDQGIYRAPEVDELCAFASKEQALEWFPQHLLNNLQSFGYYLVEKRHYTITAVGEKQVLVKPEGMVLA